MGAFKRFSSGSDYNWTTNTRPNPNKYRFEIRRFETGAVFDLVLVNYPHCTTFDGDKLLVVKKGSVSFEMQGTELDPHFFEDSIIMARFPPTDMGFYLARKII